MMFIEDAVDNIQTINGRIRQMNIIQFQVK